MEYSKETWRDPAALCPSPVGLETGPVTCSALLCCLGLFHGVRSSLGVEYHGGDGGGAQPVSCCGWTPIPVQKPLEQRTHGDDWELMMRTEPVSHWALP